MKGKELATSSSSTLRRRGKGREARETRGESRGEVMGAGVRAGLAGRVALEREKRREMMRRWSAHLLSPKSETFAVKPLGSLFELFRRTCDPIMKGERGMRLRAK